MTRHVSLKRKIEDCYKSSRIGLSSEEDQLAQYVANTLSCRGYSHSERLDKVTQRLTESNYLTNMSEKGLECINGLLERHYGHLKENSASIKERNRKGLNKEFTESKKIKGLGKAGMTNYRLRNNLTEKIEQKVIAGCNYDLREISLELPTYITAEEKNEKRSDPYDIQMSNKQAIMFSQALIAASFGQGIYSERKPSNLMNRAKNFAKAALVLIPLTMTSCFSHNRSDKSNLIEPSTRQETSINNIYLAKGK